MSSRRANVFMVPTEEGTFGDLLRNLREERGWSQQEVAERVTQVLYPAGEGKVWQGMISNYERGRIKNPGPTMAQALDTIFDLTPGTMFSRINPRGGKHRVERGSGPTSSVDRRRYAIASHEGELTTDVQAAQDILLEMLMDRFERAVDALLRSRMGAQLDRQTLLDALFALYEDGILTKSEVRRRGSLEPEAFYDELRAYRQRHHSRNETLRTIEAMEFASPDDPESDRFPLNVPTTFSEAEGAEIERIMDDGAPAWVAAIRERIGR